MEKCDWSTRTTRSTRPGVGSPRSATSIVATGCAGGAVRAAAGAGHGRACGTLPGVTRRRLGTGPAPTPAAAPNTVDDVARLTVAARAAAHSVVDDPGAEQRPARRYLGRGAAGAAPDDAVRG